MCFFTIVFKPFTWLYFKLSTAQCDRPRRIRDIQVSRRILSGSTLESRAVPNERLVDAFGINNAFTTTDPEYHKAFVNQAKSLIRTAEDEWISLAIAAAEIVAADLATLRGANTDPMFLVKFVQSLVFRVVIIKFFPGSGTPSAADVEFITTKINELWLASKRYCHGADDLKRILDDNNANDRDKRELLRKLYSFIKPHPKSRQSPPRSEPDHENPLNWILPAYETLWRVVMNCFLEVRFRATPTDTVAYRALFEQFSTQPCQSTFETLLSMSPPTNEDVTGPRAAVSVSVKHIVDETLRLYPPTRRINRRLSALENSSGPDTCPIDRTVAIDIEFMHRNPATWGSDASLFRPQRWAEGNFDKKAFMPFGMGVFECPAKKTFGPMMIGVCVGALAGGVGAGWEVVSKGGRDKDGSVEGGRAAFAGCVLRAVEG